MSDPSRPPVDFAAIRRRLDVAEEALRPSVSQERAILRERARLLALDEARAREPAGEALSVVSFTVGGGRYALGLEFVREVMELASLTPLPGVPAFVRGIFSWRGDVRSAVDLAAFLGEAGALTDLTRVILVEHKRMEIGLLCAPAVATLEVHPAELARVEGSRGELALGALADGTLVLNGAALLSSPRLVVG